MTMKGLSEHRRDKTESMESYCKAYQTYKGRHNKSWRLAIEGQDE